MMAMEVWWVMSRLRAGVGDALMLGGAKQGVVGDEQAACGCG